MMDLLNRFVYKITSGRFIITILLSVAYVYAAMNGKVSTELNAIYIMVVTFYFTKKNDNNPNIKE